MKRPRHTPEPWHVVILESFDVVSYTIQEDHSENEDDPEAIANKHLIQAAPFLLKELRLAVALLKNRYAAPDDETLSMVHALLKGDGKL
jgi:hypothetical protein